MLCSEGCNERFYQVKKARKSISKGRAWEKALRCGRTQGKQLVRSKVAQWAGLGLCEGSEAGPTPAVQGQRAEAGRSVRRLLTAASGSTLTGSPSGSHHPYGHHQANGSVPGS